MTNVIVAGARTPIGRLGGGLASHTAATLGATAIAAALERAGVDPAEVGTVVMGQVIQAGAGPNPARKAAVDAGIPMSVPAMTLNKLCLSGLASIVLADQLVASGRHRVVVAGGMESMTQAPFVVPTDHGPRRVVGEHLTDALDSDALVCGFDQIHVGAATDRYQRPLGIAREEQDEFASRSHARAIAATEEGRFDEEITLVPGSTLTVDEGARADVTAGASRPPPPRLRRGRHHHRRLRQPDYLTAPAPSW